MLGVPTGNGEAIPAVGCVRICQGGSGMWYVVQTMSGQEGQVKNFIAKTVEPGLVQEAFIPRYEVMKRVKGLWCKRVEVLMPGYVFVVTKSPSKLKAQLRGVPRFTRLLGNDDMFTPLDDRDIAFINAFTSLENRTVEMSTGVVEGDDVIILNGPLMGRAGWIKKIDRHKRLAYLEVEMLGRTTTVKLGLEIVAKRC